MKDKSTTSSGGIGISGALFIVFLTLKLTGVVNWSWWWVTAPLWGGVVVGLGVVLLSLIIAAVMLKLKK